MRSQHRMCFKHALHQHIASQSSYDVWLTEGIQQPSSGSKPMPLKLLSKSVILPTFISFFNSYIFGHKLSYILTVAISHSSSSLHSLFRPFQNSHERKHTASTMRSSCEALARIIRNRTQEYSFMRQKHAEGSQHRVYRYERPKTVNKWGLRASVFLIWSIHHTGLLYFTRYRKPTGQKLSTVLSSSMAENNNRVCKVRYCHFLPSAL